LVRISGRADDLGRPLLYGTTKRFLQLFGLRHVDELPRAEALRRRSSAGESAETRPGASQANQAYPPASA
jgi:segregation and condensation protein B